MERRSFFGRLIAAASVFLFSSKATATTAPSTTRHPRHDLDAFNAQFAGYNVAEIVGNWSIFFTGFKASQEQSTLYGQWLAWPRADLPVEQRQAISRYFYANVPRPPLSTETYWEAEYRRGQSFPLHALVDLGTFGTPDGRESVAEMVADGRRRLLRVMREAGVI